jgi:hypothetical protein
VFQAAKSIGLEGRIELAMEGGAPRVNRVRVRKPLAHRMIQFAKQSDFEKGLGRRFVDLHI